MTLFEDKKNIITSNIIKNTPLFLNKQINIESIKNKIILFKGQLVLLYFSMKSIINIIRSITKVV